MTNGRVREYIGARYVPIFADPVEWDDERTYEPLMMVQYQGETYMSKQYVPVDVPLPDVSQGTESNDYWVHMSNWNAQVEGYREEVLRYAEEVQTFDGRIDDLEAALPSTSFDSTNTVAAAISDIEDEIGSGFDSTNTVAAAISNETQAREIQDALRAISFVNVAAMKASTDLEDGIYCHTDGFYSSGDGGAAWYLITDTGMANEMDVIACGDLYANLVHQTIETPEMYGAVGNGVADDADAFNQCLLNGNKKVVCTKSQYLVNSSLKFYTRTHFDGNGATFSHTVNTRMFDKYIRSDAVRLDNMIIENCNMVSFNDKTTTQTETDWQNNTYDCAIVISTNVHNITVRNCSIKNFVYGIFLGGQYGENAIFENIRFDNCARCIDTFCEHTHIKDCWFYNSNYPIQIEPNANTAAGDYLISGCFFRLCDYGIYLNTSDTSNAIADGVIITDCTMLQQSGDAIHIGTGSPNVVIDNVYADGCDFAVRGGKNSTIIRNSFFDGKNDTSHNQYALAPATGSVKYYVENTTLANFGYSAISGGSQKMYLNGLKVEGTPRLSNWFAGDLVMKNCMCDDTTWGYFNNIDPNATIMIDGFVHGHNALPSSIESLVANNTLKCWNPTSA